MENRKNTENIMSLEQALKIEEKIFISLRTIISKRMNLKEDKIFKNSIMSTDLNLNVIDTIAIVQELEKEFPDIQISKEGLKYILPLSEFPVETLVSISFGFIHQRYGADSEGFWRQQRSR